MKINRKRLLIVIAVLAVASAVAFRLFLNARSGSGQAAQVHIAAEQGTTYQQLPYQEDILLVGSEGIKAYNAAGEEKWNISKAMANPFADIGGKYILLSDLSGKSYALYSGSKLLYEAELQTALISAKVNSNGYSILISEETGYNGVVTVFDLKGEEVFKWYSGEGYVVDADLSDDNRYLAVAQLMTDRDKLYSRFLVFDIRTNETVASAEREDSMMVKVQYNDGNWNVVSDTELLGYSKNGKERFAVNFGGREVSDFNIDNPNNMVIAMINSQNNTVLEMYDKNGKLRGSYEASGELKNLSVSGEVIVCSQLRELFYIDPAGQVRSRQSVSHDIKSIRLFGDRRHALVMGGSTANIVTVR